MAMADYRCCDIRGGKAFYDANLNYDFDNPDPKTGEYPLDYLGDWSVICQDCAKDYRTEVVKK